MKNVAEDEKRILLVGAGVAGLMLASDIKKRTNYTVVGFVDDRSGLRGGLGEVRGMAKVVKEKEVDEIVISVPSADGSLIRHVLLANLNNRVPIRLIPRELKVLRSNLVSYEQTKMVETDDWLGRPINKIELDQLARWWQNKVAVVTGGAGSIGSEIVRQLLALKVKQVIVYDNSEYLCYLLQQEIAESKLAPDRFKVVIGDITNQKKISRILAQYQPQLVIHAAAYKHVYLMEENADEALRVNFLGTVKVTDVVAAEKVKKLVMLSTDKAVNPRGVMGASKKLAEQYLLAKPSDFQRCVVRFGNVINSRGSVLPLFERQIREKRYVTLTDPKMERFFMSIREAAQLVLVAATEPGDRSLYLLDMGDLIPLDIVAKCLIRSQNLIPGQDIEIRVLGSRPGEKLKEQLFTPGEKKNLQLTKQANIWQVKKTDQRPLAEIERLVSEARALVRENARADKIRSFLRQA